MQKFFNAQEWQNRSTYLKILKDICTDEGIKLSFLSEYWVCRLVKDDTTVHLIGMHFPLNSVVAASIARDKVSTYLLLHESRVPAIEHELVRFPPGLPAATIAQSTAASCTYPVVMKPMDRGGGTDVYMADDRAQLETQLMNMAQRYELIAISPFVEISDEFRVVILDGQVLLSFRKVRTNANAEWRHNLRYGAVPEPLSSSKIAADIGAMARSAMQVLQLRLAAVDIVTTPQGMYVLEVNAEFSLMKVAAHNAFRPQVIEIYRQAVRACFQLQA